MKSPTRTHLGNRGTWNDDLELPPAVFEKADSLRLEQAPTRCDRCGGPWQYCDEGYRCIQCSRRWRAADCLAAMVGRPYANGERWPTVPGRDRTGTRGSS